MSNTKIEKYKTNMFTINLPKDWKVETEGNIYSLYNPDGFGVIQISTYSKKKSRNKDTHTILEFEIKKIICRKNIKNVKIRRIQTSRYRGAIISFVQANRFWKILITCSRDAIAFMTYNCEDKHKHLEVKIVNSIIDTFQFVNKK